MSDFLVSALKGMYPAYLLLAIWGIGLRMRRGEWKWQGFDTLLLGMFLLFELLMLFLPWFFYGELTTSRRYLLIGVVLYFPFAAEGARQLWKICGNRRVVMLLILWGIFLIYDIYSPLIKEYTSMRKSRERQLSTLCAAWIKSDWEKCSETAAGRAEERIRVLRCDQYQSGKRPLVDSPFDRIGYLCGGQAYSPFLAGEGIEPDYVVNEEPFPPSDGSWTPVHTIITGVRDAIHIYRKTEILNEK